MAGPGLAGRGGARRGIPFRDGPDAAIREFDGQTYVMERALCPEVALVKAHKADKSGNLIFRRTARNFNPAAAMAGKLTVGEGVRWNFATAAPVDFNIHYHEGKDVRYPERRDALAGASGRLQVVLDQDYCWMWTNKSGQAVDLNLLLTR